MEWTKLSGIAAAAAVCAHCVRFTQIVDRQQSYRVSMKAVAAAMMLAASLTVVAPATAHADSVPTVDQVVAIMAKLTDPNIPAANKGDIVTPGFSPEEAGTTDDHLNRMNAIRLLPLNFVVTDIQPAPGNLAGATVSTTGSFWQVAYPKPIVLADQGGHWQASWQRQQVRLIVVRDGAFCHHNVDARRLQLCRHRRDRLRAGTRSPPRKAFHGTMAPSQPMSCRTLGA